MKSPFLLVVAGANSQLNVVNASISCVRTFALFAGVALCLALGVPRAILAAPVAGNPTPAWNGLALTPPMGCNNWSYFQCKINEDLILSQAKALVSNGLAKKGYDTITIDDCWMAKKRNSDGTLAADPQEFPQGMDGTAGSRVGPQVLYPRGCGRNDMRTESRWDRRLTSLV
jgi:alpha galactosidase A-like protein